MLSEKQQNIFICRKFIHQTNEIILPETLLTKYEYIL